MRRARAGLAVVAGGWLVAGLVAATGAGGCATAAAPVSTANPRGGGDGDARRRGIAVLAAYRDALTGGRPDEAWALLAPGELDRETFRAYFQAHRQGMILQAEEALRAARASRPEEVAVVRSGDRIYEVVHTPAGWRIRGIRAAKPARATAPGDRETTPVKRN